MRNQWGIGNSHGWFTREEVILANARTNYISVGENSENKTVLYGPRGEALIVKQPRKVGFREPK